MRLAPVPAFFADDPGRALELCAASSRTTHATLAAVDACRYFGALLLGALRGATREELLSPFFTPVPGYWERAPLVPEIAEIAAGSFRGKRPPEIRGRVYVVDTLEAALWAFHATADFRTGCLAAANLGDDADTTAAIFGQIGGAFYGEGGIPAEWRDRLAMWEVVDRYAEGLAGGAGASAP
jgi:ADP-ribosylglycohydrolase